MTNRFTLVVEAELLRNYLPGFSPRQILPRVRISTSCAMLPSMA